MRLKLFALLILLPRPYVLNAAPVLKVRVPANESALDVRHDYDHDIIRLLLSKTEREFGPFELHPTHRMNQFRALSGLINGKLIDLMPTTSSLEREGLLRPVRHSIHKSLMGLRLLLIKKERQEEFAKIKTVEELKKLLAGQGDDWTDVPILRSNGFKVVTGHDYDGLFRMLSAGRFDFFPRSVAEIYPELKAHEKEGLVVEGTILLAYSMPAYIFVKKDNKALAERLEKGWDIALQDGSFEKLFRAKHGESLKRAELYRRRVFFLNNPFSSEKNPDFSPLLKPEPSESKSLEANQSTDRPEENKKNL